MLYIIRPKNYEEQVYDIIILEDNVKDAIPNGTILHYVDYSLKDIRALFDPSGKTSYIENSILYMQSGFLIV